MGKDPEGSDQDLKVILFWNLPGGEENHEKSYMVPRSGFERNTIRR